MRARRERRRDGGEEGRMERRGNGEGTNGGNTFKR